MAVRFVRPVSSSAYGARRLALGAFLLLLIAMLAHRFGPLQTPQFVAVMLLSAAIALLSVPLALTGLMRLWSIGARGGIASVQALLLATPSLLILAFGIWRFETAPKLFDLTTDMADPPVWVRVPEAEQIFLPRPMFVTSKDRDLQKRAYPALTGRRYEGAPDRVFEAVMKVAKAEAISLKTDGAARAASPGGSLAPAPARTAGGNASEGADPPPAEASAGEPRATPPLPSIVPVPLPRPISQEVLATAQPMGDVVLQGATRTLVLGLPFDVLVRLREEEETVLVDIRVAARYGAHDLGFGAGIADRFLRALDAEMLGIAAE
ncbi:DUF1499 domain-containing protein [Rhizobium sp. SSA_523]|uniref:DUF1499 domain-containing protein n=1 Tax=Rhizobium sp. SSA_523 TaxID=2952477 RepID=UPI0020917E4C|nr:DUF1499 domain-containing protein [Rhizobium sp. SSA_523]MCO5731008.1 DUF1499 domain-containing protein [Rhizobium sp. SSA_523]WKC24187.1 DUF1499 domain-containing protein [Rhizobium sp. SSA_523]